MPTPERTRLTWSSRTALKVAGVIAALMAVAVVVALTARAQADLGGARSQRLGTRATPVAGVRSPAPRALAPAPPRASKSTPKPITVVGIGDSVTAGKNCDCQNFVELYARSLASTRSVKTSSVNLGVSGWTSTQLLQSLTRPGAFRDQVAKADILLVTIGANDLVPLETLQSAGCATNCYSALVTSVGQNVRRIVAAARQARTGHPATILVTNYWNVFQDGDVGTAENGAAFQRWSDLLTRASGAQICDGALRAGATCVDLYEPFKGDGSRNPTSLLASDGDHPSPAGHQLIASTLLASTPLLIP